MLVFAVRVSPPLGGWLNRAEKHQSIASIITPKKGMKPLKSRLNERYESGPAASLHGDPVRPIRA